MVVVVEIALEAMLDVEHLSKAGVDQGLAGGLGAVARAADEQDGALVAVAHQLADFAHKVWAHPPVGAAVPRHVDGADGVADEQVFDLAAHIDQQRAGVRLQEGVRLGGGDLLHVLFSLGAEFGHGLHTISPR